MKRFLTNTFRNGRTGEGRITIKILHAWKQMAEQSLVSRTGAWVGSGEHWEPTSSLPQSCQRTQTLVATGTSGAGWGRERLQIKRPGKGIKRSSHTSQGRPHPSAGRVLPSSPAEDVDQFSRESKCTRDARQKTGNQKMGIKWKCVYWFSWNPQPPEHWQSEHCGLDRLENSSLSNQPAQE